MSRWLGSGAIGKVRIGVRSGRKPKSKTNAGMDIGVSSERAEVEQTAWNQQPPES